MYTEKNIPDYMFKALILATILIYIYIQDNVNKRDQKSCILFSVYAMKWKWASGNVLLSSVVLAKTSARCQRHIKQYRISLILLGQMIEVAPTAITATTSSTITFNKFARLSS